MNLIRSRFSLFGTPHSWIAFGEQHWRTTLKIRDYYNGCSQGLGSEFVNEF